MNRRTILFFLIFFLTATLIFTMSHKKEGESNLIEKFVETITVDYQPTYTAEHRFLIPEEFDLVKKVMLHKDPQPFIVEANHGKMILSSQIEESDVISVSPLIVEAKTSYSVEYNKEFTAILEMEQDCSFQREDIRTHTRMVEPTERLKKYECLIKLRKSDRGTLGVIQITLSVNYRVPKGTTGIVDKRLKKAAEEECITTATALATYVGQHKNDRFTLRELLEKRKKPE